MSDIELIWLKRNHPQKLLEWIELEHQKLIKYAGKTSKNCGVFASTNTISQRLLKAEEKHGYLSGLELKNYKFSHGCVKSIY
jgi:hypothetical protein